MNIIKKYWDSVYIYVLLLIPGFCMCAGLYWSGCKLMGLYEHLSWMQILVFDFTQLIYLAIALYFIRQNKRNSSYIPEHLLHIKCYTVVILLIQYNYILYLFPSEHVWIDTFLFFCILAFLFDSKLMLINIILYLISLVIAHIVKMEEFLPLGDKNIAEIIAYRILIYTLTSFCILVIVYFVERFLMQAREEREENMQLMEKQLKYYRDMKLMDAEVRKFRHDINNHFICMETLIRNEKIDELQKYFDDLQMTISKQNKVYFSGNEIVDAILNYDLNFSCKEEVKITSYGKLPEIETVSAMDLCTLFSNLLSNAISSANKCIDLGEAEITIRFASGKNYFSIEMSNSIPAQNSKKIKIERSKSRNHGHGLRKIKQVLDKYDGKYELEIEENLLNVKIYLPV